MERRSTECASASSAARCGCRPGKKVECDLDEKARAKLSRILRGYQKNRPKLEK
jgi:hypothetical protein